MLARSSVKNLQTYKIISVSPSRCDAIQRASRLPPLLKQIGKRFDQAAVYRHRFATFEVFTLSCVYFNYRTEF